MCKGRKTASARFKAFSVPMLAILVLCIALFSSAVSADWAECVQARLDGENAVSLLVTADEQGTVTFTIDKNVITFAVLANVELDTGKLRIDKAESVVVELSDVAGAVTARCTTLVKQITEQYKTFCCDRKWPDVRVVVEPPLGPVSERVGNEASSVTLTAQTCSVSGQVSDSSTHQPISGVTVSIEQTGASQTTDSEGRFSFTGLDPGWYNLRFVKSASYEPGQAIVHVDSGALEIPVELSPIEPEEPYISLSWTPNPADSPIEWTAHVNGTVTLYLRAPEGSQCVFYCDSTENRDLPRIVFGGVELGVSGRGRKEPADACLETSGCEYSVRFLAGADAGMNYSSVDIQAYAVLADSSGYRILVSEVLTLYIEY